MLLLVLVLLLLLLLLLWVLLVLVLLVLLLVRSVGGGHFRGDPLATVPPQNCAFALQIANLEVAETAKQEEVVV